MYKPEVWNVKVPEVSSHHSYYSSCCCYRLDALAGWLQIGSDDNTKVPLLQYWFQLSPLVPSILVSHECPICMTLP